MRSRLLVALSLCVLVFSGANQALASYASIVVDARDGSVVHAVNADTPNYPASLTKIMTLYLTFAALDSGRLKLDQMLPVSRLAAGRAPSRLGLRRGQTISVRDAIGGLITKSANDAATVLAEALAGSEIEFARLMTEKAHELGMANTTFRNASGLPHRSQVTTARDMATLGRAIINQYPHHYHYFSTIQFRYLGRTYRNHNRLLTAYEGTDGIKTGYIRAVGYNLVASVQRGDRRLIGVVLGGKGPRARDRQMAELFDKAYEGDGIAVAGTPSPPAPAGALAGRPDSPGAVAAALPAPAQRTKAGQPVPPPPVTAAVARDAIGETGGEWSVQVGAFSRYAQAHIAVSRATKAMPILQGNPVSIQRDETSRSNLYRARIVGLSEEDARKSCRTLKRKKLDCLALPHSLYGEEQGEGGSE